MELHEKLKLIRKLLGLTQEQMAKQSNIPRKEISLLETGDRKFVPKEYIIFLIKNNIDINSLYDDAIEEVCFINEKKQNACENCELLKTISELRENFATLNKILEKKV